MTKEEFRQLVAHGVEHLTSIPDDLWEVSQPIIELSYAGEVIVVGIKEDEPEAEDEF